MLRQERPYHDDSTASRLLSEVKHRRARLVLRWGTTLESRVLFFYIFLSFYPLMEDSTFLQKLFTKKIHGTWYQLPGTLIKLTNGIIHNIYISIRTGNTNHTVLLGTYFTPYHINQQNMLVQGKIPHTFTCTLLLPQPTMSNKSHHSYTPSI